MLLLLRSISRDQPHVVHVVLVHTRPDVRGLGADLVDGPEHIIVGESERIQCDTVDRTLEIVVPDAYHPAPADAGMDMDMHRIIVERCAVAVLEHLSGGLGRTATLANSMVFGQDTPPSSLMIY